ncbi:MAG TPA: hypothetical protein VGN72_11150 [Tepidisphaeraceae bacterium]|nr:hypothetical protein [Tepidisphaeraceae bacterium]
MSASVGDALRRHEHTAVDLVTAGLPPAADPMTVLDAARKGQLDIVTTDDALVLAATKAKPLKRSVVYLQLEGQDVEQDDAIDRLFTRYKRLTPNRLYTVTENRVKVRQLPGA